MTNSGKRVYRSDLRADQARATRRQVVTAASRLFAERGYAATTIAAIAAEAGVSRKTVFTSVGGKVELMKLAYDWAIAGDDEPVAKVDRPEILELQAEPDASVVIEKYVAGLDESMTRVAPIHDALRSAADVDEGRKSTGRVASAIQAVTRRAKGHVVPLTTRDGRAVGAACLDHLHEPGNLVDIDVINPVGISSTATPFHASVESREHDCLLKAWGGKRSEIGRELDSLERVGISLR